jgi:hypothetical protein
MRHHIATQLRRAGDPDSKGLTRREYIRAYGNRIQSAIGGWQVISQPAWVAAMAKRPIPPGVPVGLGFEADPDGRDAAIAVAWRGPDGVAVVEVITVRDGVAWLGAGVRQLCEKWDVWQVATQNAGPSRHVADALIATEGGIRIRGERVNEFLRMSQMDFSAACALFKTGVTAPHPTVLHIGQAPLNSAVEHVGKRRTGPTGSWSWQIDPDVSITTLVAGTAAVWACDHPRETEEELGPFRMY